MLISDDRHLPSILAKYEAYFNGRRHHCSRQFRPPQPNCPTATLRRSGSSAVLAASSTNISGLRRNPSQRDGGRILAPPSLATTLLPPSIPVPFFNIVIYIAQLLVRETTKRRFVISPIQCIHMLHVGCTATQRIGA